MSEEAVQPEVTAEETSTEEISEETQAENTEEQPEQQEEPRYTVKIDGEEVEMTVEEMRRYASLGKASDKRFEEAAKQRKEAEEIFKKYKENPKEALSELDREVVEEYLAELIQQDSMSDEEKDRLKEKKELEELRQREEQRKREDEQRQLNQLQQQYAEEYQQKIIQTLDQSDLPKNPATVRKVAEIMYKSLENGYDIPSEHIAGFVKEDMQKGLRESLSALEGKQLIDYLGEDTLKKIRAADIARVKKAEPQVKAPANPDRPSRREQKKVDMNSYFKGLLKS